MLMITGFVMRLLKIPEGGIVEVIVGSILSFFYAVGTFFLLNGTSFKKTYERSDPNTKPADILKSVFSGLIFSYTILALVFKTMVWPSEQSMMETALILLTIMLVIAIVAYSRNKKESNKQLLVRVIIYATVSVVAWLVPAQSFLLSRH